MWSCPPSGPLGLREGCAEPIGRRAARPGCPVWRWPDCSEHSGPGAGSFWPPVVGEGILGLGWFYALREGILEWK